MSEKVSIGIDLGGTAIKYGLVGENGEMYWHSIRPTKAATSVKEVLNNIFDACSEVCKMANEMDLKIDAIGIGTPGLVEKCDVVLGEANNIVGWENLPLGTLISNHLKLPTFVANDGEMMGLGEFNVSCTSKNETALFITLGTGIGGAIFINGELFQGHFGAGGELGVFPMVLNNKVLNWEDIASTSAMVKEYIDAGNLNEVDFEINGEYIIKKFLEGEVLAVESVEKSTKYIAMGIGGYINVFNPKKVVIGGGISQSGDFFINKIREKISKYALKECFKNVEVVAASLGNNAGFIGAGIFALKKNQQK